MNHHLITDKPLGPSPLPSSMATTKTMKANRGKNTTPEIILRKALRKVGAPGYRLHWNHVPGRPDISYPGKRIAIFVNGCFWHRCPKCNLPLPKSHKDFWKRKFAKNKKRDRDKIKKLTNLGWEVIVFWECELKKNPMKPANIVYRKLKKMRSFEG